MLRESISKNLHGFIKFIKQKGSLSLFIYHCNDNNLLNTAKGLFTR